MIGKLRRKKLLPYLLILPALGILGLVTFYPVGYSFWISLFSYNLLRPWTKHFVGWGNYLELITSARFLHAIKISVVFAAIAVSVELLIGGGIALVLNMIRRRRIYLTAILIPMMIAPVTVGLMWRIMYNSHFGIINYFLSVFGIEPKLWLASSLAMPAIIMVDIWQASPFCVLVLMAGLQGLPLGVYDAAEVDGASVLQKFRYITVPLLLPVIQVILLLRTMDALRIFDTVWTMTKGGPGEATNVVNMEIYRTTFEGLRIGEGAAGAVILLFIIMLISLFFIHTLSQKATV